MIDYFTHDRLHTTFSTCPILAFPHCVHMSWEKNASIWDYFGNVFGLQQSVQFSSSLSHVQLFATRGMHNARLPCTSPTPRACLNSCLLSQWCHPTISSSVVSISSYLQSFPKSGSVPLNQFFASGGQNIRVSASASVLPMNIQDWFPLGWTGWISVQSKELSRVFSNTTVQKRKFFWAQLSL